MSDDKKNKHLGSSLDKFLEEEKMGPKILIKEHIKAFDHLLSSYIKISKINSVFTVRSQAIIILTTVVSRLANCADSLDELSALSADLSKFIGFSIMKRKEEIQRGKR